MLAQAERPVIVAGGGVIWSGAEAELVKLAELLQIPVATSLNAKAALPDDHPLNVGVPGTYSRWCANRVIAEADLVFFVGSHTGGQVTTNWQVPKPGIAAIQLDIDPEELGRNYPLQAALLGDAKVTLQKLIAAARPAARARRSGSAACRAWCASIARNPIGCAAPTPCPSARSGSARRSPSGCPRAASCCRTPATPACGPAR